MLEPFKKYAIDFLGPITQTYLNKIHILVYTNFVTKWVESRTIPYATEKFVVDF